MHVLDDRMRFTQPWPNMLVGLHKIGSGFLLLLLSGSLSVNNKMYTLSGSLPSLLSSNGKSNKILFDDSLGLIVFAVWDFDFNFIYSSLYSHLFRDCILTTIFWSIFLSQVDGFITNSIRFSISPRDECCNERETHKNKSVAPPFLSRKTHAKLFKFHYTVSMRLSSN